MSEDTKTPKVTIGSVAREAILAGQSNKETLATVKAQFPDSKTTLNSINWYRNDLRKKGHDVPSPQKAKATEGGDDLTS
jgi:hypothetical protein